MTSRTTLSCLALAALMLGGCVLQRHDAPEPGAVPESDSSAAAIDASAQLARLGRWGEARDLLEEARRRDPESGALVVQQERLEKGQTAAERELEDRILLGDATNMVNKVELFSGWLKVVPDDLAIKARRIYWNRALVDRLEPLITCAETHAQTRPQLARRCVDLASDIPGVENRDVRLAIVEQKLAAREQVEKKRRQQRKASAARKKVRESLDAVRAAVNAGDYRLALDLLEKVAELQPGNEEMVALRRQAERSLDPQTEALIVLGDRLYLDEQLDAALASWRAALELRPEDEDILARIERAQTVLDRLETLRGQQNSP